MRYLTDRKRAEGLGAAKSGTEHHWNMQVSAVALAVLVPLFIFIVGPVIGAPLERVIMRLAHPVPAVITGLTLVVGLTHFKNGARMMIEDYAQGAARKALILATSGFAHLLMATGLFALVRLALIPFLIRG